MSWLFLLQAGTYTYCLLCPEVNIYIYIYIYIYMYVCIYIYIYVYIYIYIHTYIYIYIFIHLFLHPFLLTRRTQTLYVMLTINNSGVLVCN